jgi:Flp pilus assembly protein TadD
VRPPPPQAAALLALPFALALGGACLARPRVNPRAAEEVARGYQHLAAGDAERAVVAFDHALAFDPRFPEGENGLGVVARTRGDLAGARRRFERALSFRADFPEAEANLGEVLLAQGDAVGAEQRLRAALAVDPDLPDARQNLARSLLRRGLEPGADRAAAFAAAREHYLHLLEADPGRAAAHHDLGFMDYLEGRYARAEASYRRAAELAPESVPALHGLCISLARQGHCAEAVLACQRCLAVQPVPECRQSLAAAQACATSRPRYPPVPGRPRRPWRPGHPSWRRR